MKSAVPKVLHRVAGRALVHYPIQAAIDAGAQRVVVVVSPDTQAEVKADVDAAFATASIRYAVQTEPQGTGDAARAGMTAVSDSADRLLLLCGDTPLLTGADIAPLLAELDAGASLVVLSCRPGDPTGYGRILRDADGQVRGIREQRDLEPEQREIAEVNSGVFAGTADAFRAGLGGLTADNAQGEYYATDMVEMLATEQDVRAIVGSSDALLGVNDRTQLAEAADLLYRVHATRLGRGGAMIHVGARIDTTATVEADATVHAGAELRGTTRVRAGAVIDVGSIVTNSTIGTNAYVKPHCVVTDSDVGAGAQVGPFAHLRPRSSLGVNAKVGNFVETKNVRLRDGAKASHLAYLGDGDVGEGANIGAGTIFCNYDGFRKHHTSIGDGAFIGSDSQLVAPVNIGKNAYVGTGTTVTKDVPDDALAVGRVRQENKLGYGARLRARLKAQAEKAKREQQ